MGASPAGWRANIVLYAALAANLGIAVAKFVAAALAGLLVAGVGIWASHAWGGPRIDGAASIAIGLILAAVAILLAREAKGLLIGERANLEVVTCVRTILGRQRGIVRINHVRTIRIAPDRIFVAISADF